MRTNKEIVERIHKLKEELQPAEDSYFSTVESKQKGESISDAEFLKIESEYETLKKELDTLLWVLEIE